MSHSWGNDGRGLLRWHADDHRFPFRWMRDLYMRLAWGEAWWAGHMRHEAANDAAFREMLTAKERAES